MRTFSVLVTQAKSAESLGRDRMHNIRYSVEGSYCTCSEQVPQPSRQRWQCTEPEYWNDLCMIEKCEHFCPHFQCTNIHPLSLLTWRQYAYLGFLVSGTTPFNTIVRDIWIKKNVYLRLACSIISLASSIMLYEFIYDAIFSCWELSNICNACNLINLLISEFLKKKCIYIYASISCNTFKSVTV